MQAIMVDTGIEQDRQILLTHNGCVVTRSTNPNNAAATVSYLNHFVVVVLLVLYYRMAVAIITHFIYLLKQKRHQFVSLVVRQDILIN